MKQQGIDPYSGKRLMLSIITISLLLMIPWGVQFFRWLVNPSIIDYGLRPWNINGIVGILTMPLLHGGFKHLISNTIPLFVMGAGLFYFYRETAWRVLFWLVILTGIWLWFIGKPESNHVGASGLVYGLAAFHFTSGLIRRNRNLTAFALLVIFLYGGLVWSIFPDFFPDQNISWEGHLSGFFAGFVMAVICRKRGPMPDPVLTDDDDDDEADPDSPAIEDIREQSPSGDDPKSVGNTNSTAGHPVQYHAT